MLQLLRSIGAQRHRCVGIFVGAVALLAGGICRGSAPSEGTRFSPVVLTNFDEVWRVADAERGMRHPVRLEYVVYYYDPLWHVMWGRSGDVDGYLSLGAKAFPIEPGQRIRIEGTMVPSTGMAVDEPKVTLLAASTPLEAVSTVGHVAETNRFNKRLVTIEGYVDAQVARDANHIELQLVAEGHAIAVQLLVKGDTMVPTWKGHYIRAKGVYSVRSEPSPQTDLWVSGVNAIETLGNMDADARFNLPITPIASLSKFTPGTTVHIAGTTRIAEPGRSLTLHDDSGEITVVVAQMHPLEPGDRVDLVGVVTRHATDWTLDDVLYRAEPKVFTAVDALYEVPDSEMQETHPFRGEVVVYFFDPYWKVMWGRNGASDTYLSLVGDTTWNLKPGQRVLVEGSVVPAKGSVIDHAKITILADNVPLPVVSATGRVGKIEELNRHLVALEGYVDRKTQTDPQHLEMDLIAEDRRVVVRLLASDGLPQVELGARVKARGVYSATSDSSGGEPKLELWVQSKDDLTVTGSLDRDERFDGPQTTAERLATASLDAPVHVAGVVWSQQPGHSITLRDETGLITVRSPQTSRLPAGTSVEAVGYPSHDATQTFLIHAMYRRASAVARPRLGLEPIQLAEEVRNLSLDDAAHNRPVQLAGVVTWANPDADFFYLHDISGGVCVLQPRDHKAAVIVGLRTEVWGVSAPGDFVPVVAATRVHYTATIDLPDARPVTLEQALTGVEEAQWVSMTGYVRDVGRSGNWERLDLTTSAGEFMVLLPSESDVTPLKGSVITAKGVCSAVANRNRQLTAVRLWVPSLQYVEVDEHAPANPFSVPLRSVASLRQFNSLQMSNRRVRIAGIVLSDSPGRFLHVQDGAEGVLVLSTEMTALQPGDRIEAVGFPGRESNRLVLREAIYRRVGHGDEPTPLRVARLAPVDPELDGRLVRVVAQLLDVSERGQNLSLILQANGSIFEGLLDVPKSEHPGAWRPGSLVEVTGVYVLDFDEYRRPHALRLQLRAPADVRVLQPASWWTAGRMIAVTSVLAAVTLLGFVWVIALRRRVRRQTAQIRDQLENEKAARLEAALARASKLESLGVLAGGIAHDFNNLLTVIMCNLSLARLDHGLEGDTERCLEEGERATARARDLTQQLLTFAKGGAPVRSSTLLPDVVRESAGFALHGAKANFEFDAAPDLWPAHVDKGQIGQVVQNIVINANQAMPNGGTISIQLCNAELTAGTVLPLKPGRFLKLTISDTGCGIPSEQLQRIFDPYFTTKQHGSGLGLATVYSIVKQHQGHIEVESTPGYGTRFTIWLPAAETAPESAVPSSPVLAQGRGRVLFMDDEPSIRQLAGTVLRRMGLEVMLVADGAQVVQEFRAAAAAGRAYDVVIVDLTVPGGMGGKEAVEALRAIDPEVRAIVSSGYSDDPVMGNHAAHGFAAVVKKPYEAADLARAVAAVLSQETTSPVA